MLNCVYTHIFSHFPHPFTSGHLDRFRVFAIVNDEAVTMAVQRSLQDNDLVSCPLDTRLEVELLDHTVVLVLIF